MEDGAGERLEHDFLGAVGEHGDEDEDGEAAGRGLGPDFAEGGEEAGCVFGPRPRAGEGVGRVCGTFDAQDGDYGDQEGDAGNRSRHGGKACRAERVKQVAGGGGGHHDAQDHQQPQDRGSRAAAACLGAGGHERENGGAGGADAQAHDGERSDGEQQAGDEVGGHQRRAGCGRDPAGGEDRHAPDDPGRAAPPHVGTEAHPGAQDLYAVVQGDERAGHDGGQRQFHHHHPVQRRGGEHHHRAQRRLHQAEADDAGPAERRHAGTIALSAKAVTIMPAT